MENKNELIDKVLSTLNELCKGGKYTDSSVKKALEEVLEVKNEETDNNKTVLDYINEDENLANLKTDMCLIIAHDKDGYHSNFSGRCSLKDRVLFYANTKDELLNLLSNDDMEKYLIEAIYESVKEDF